MSRISLSLLGGFEARLAGGKPVRLPPKKAQALLAYLAVRPGQAHARDNLAALLWERPDAQARANLRQTLTRLSRALPGAIVADASTVTLDASRVDVDVVAFEALIADATPTALEEATALYRGDVLAGIRVAEDAF